MMRALIIEDEPKVSKELKNIILNLRPDISVLSTLESVEDTVAWLQHHEAPDIIFSDIQLSDGLSFDIFKKVTIHTPVIFCTAFDEYMLNAFETNGIYYLLKPITPAKLEEALKKYEELRQSFDRTKDDYTKRIERLLDHLPSAYRSTLLVNFRDKITPVKTDDIAFLYYSNGVVTVSLFNEQQYFIQETLDDLEAKLNPQVFFRANRQFIVHRHSIKDIERYFSRKLIIRLSVKTPENIMVSKLKSFVLLSWLENS
jgi:DNA-binding LytR/AlgR family response regulator